MTNGAFDFTGRVAVVTGAGGGIGRAHALLLASLGAAVVVNDVGKDLHGSGDVGSAADDVVSEIVAAGGRAVASSSSIATPDGGGAVVTAALEEWGRLDAVIHNAGILRDKTIAKLSPDDVDAVLAVHLNGAFNVLRAAYPVMREQGYGRAVLTSSASGLFGTFGQANYAAAKMGLIGLMNVLSVEGARHGILANAIAPTARTRMTEDLLGDLADHFDPALVSPLVAYLVSERCTLTHRIFTVGGGRIGRVFVGVTPGRFFGSEPTTPEEIERHLDEVLDLAGHVVPEDGTDEVELIRRVVVGD